VLPATTQMLPITTQFLPVTTQVLQTTTKVLPATMQMLPITILSGYVYQCNDCTSKHYACVANVASEIM
jgi:hypothetical protein